MSGSTTSQITASIGSVWPSATRKASAPDGDPAHHRLVLDDEEGLVAPKTGGDDFGRVAVIRCSGGPGKVDLEARALTGLGVQPDVPAVLFDDPVTGRQTQSRSRPRILGREEGLERVRLHRALHAGARVADRELQERPRHDFRVQPADVIVEMHVARFVGHGSPARHRVSSVDRQVDQ
jgi:hypothetical protein